MSRVHSVAHGQERDRLIGLFEEFGVAYADPVPFAVYPDETDVDDQLWIIPDPMTHDLLADIIMSIADRCRQTYPGRRHWSRWKLTRKVSSFLYMSGITSSGGSSSSDGNDPIPTWIYTLPRFNRNQRPYILGKQRWWWECHQRQGWHLSGRHWPAYPYAFGVCAKCVPCPACGSPYECTDVCTELVPSR